MDSLVGDITAMKASQVSDAVSIWALKLSMNQAESHTAALLSILPPPAPTPRAGSTFDTYA